ncbi:unnamed protein product [Lasius platythorax]|uniref:Uncharacterized protein n=1 Tax=Lasius platythorax TaxID=488582 RepID=A0AAV2NK06_9HYME
MVLLERATRDLSPTKAKTLGTRGEDIGPSFPSNRHRGDADAVGVLLDSRSLGESVSYMDEGAQTLSGI